MSEIKIHNGTRYDSYTDYLRSDVWRRFRRRYFKSYPKLCVLCYSTNDINLHHRYYNRDGVTILGRELFIDVCALCRVCHVKIHTLKLEAWLADRYFLRKNKLIALRKKLGIVAEHKEVLPKCLKKLGRKFSPRKKKSNAKAKRHGLAPFALPERDRILFNRAMAQKTWS